MVDRDPHGYGSRRGRREGERKERDGDAIGGSETLGRHDGGLLTAAPLGSFRRLGCSHEKGDDRPPTP